MKIIRQIWPILALEAAMFILWLEVARHAHV